MKHLLLTALLLVVLVAGTYASPATPELRNDTPLGRCYVRCDDLAIQFYWCTAGCRAVAEGR